eukprot:1226631-Alexandrium_andersonii.AAC.1
MLPAVPGKATLGGRMPRSLGTRTAPVWWMEPTLLSPLAVGTAMWMPGWVGSPRVAFLGRGASPPPLRRRLSPLLAAAAAAVGFLCVSSILHGSCRTCQ